MSKLYLATGVIIATLTLAGGNASASDLNKTTFDLLLINQSSPTRIFVDTEPRLPSALSVKPLEPEPKPEPEPPEPVRYTVVSGDNLTKIAAANDTTWLRLWNKNEVLTNPDLIFPGQVFLIPDVNEKLKDRPVPAAVAEALSNAAPQRSGSLPRGPVAGNTYDPGYCTWYVKNRRPDLPNGLGNANTWYSRAAAMGMAVGSTPRAGAVGTTTAGDYGHVVYVESVNGGMVTISEMNYRGLYQTNTRTVPASDFRYIY